MYKWRRLLLSILNNGEVRHTRRGETLGGFGYHMQMNIAEGFPAVTTKKLHFKSVAAELAGFLRAETDASKMGSDIWLADAERWHKQSAESTGPTDMGRVYGAQWRAWDFGDVDQLRMAVNGLADFPHERYHLVTAWNPGERDLMCLEPCHYAFQFYRHGLDDKLLSCMFQMRSVDVFLGLPFDIASYALLTHIVANELDLMPANLIASLGDTHIYKNHLPQVGRVLDRLPYNAPTLKLDPEATIDNFTEKMAELENYKCHSAVPAPMNNEQVG